MNVLFTSLIVIVVFGGPFIIAGIYLHRRWKEREKTYNNLPQKEKDLVNSEETSRINQFINLVSVLSGGMAVKLGFGWLIAVSITVGGILIGLLVTKYLNK